MTRGIPCWMLVIKSRGPPILPGGTGRMDPDLSFGDGVSSIKSR
jgi:hypothetical protein